jgi:hypothetical protein
MPMRWSQLKSRIESFLAPSLAERVALHQARYRQTHEEVGRIWVTIDGREVADFATHKGWRNVRTLADQLMDERQAWGTTAAYAEATTDAESQLRSQGEFSDATALDLLEQYLSLPFEEALSSSNPLLRALAIADRRLGKRRLRSIQLTPDDHPLVRELYTARCLAEHVEINAPAV